jgi:hypothetical protein
MRDRLLIRHFLQRFLDHDLISPHADRREVLAVTVAGVVSLSLFLSVLLAVKYQFNMFLPPGLTAAYTLDDRFFLITAGMLLVGLLAVAQWDALALDSRDTAVLGPLPIPRAAIVRAKFAAVGILAAGVVLAWTLPSTLLRAVALPPKLPVPATGVVRLMMAYGAASVLAMASAFLAVLGLRECLRATLGQSGFDRVSGAVQALLIISGLSALLLLPGYSGNVAGRWLSDQSGLTSALPPLWFLGLHEWLAGPVIDGLPRGPLLPSVDRAEQSATALYRMASLQFGPFAAVAVLGFMLVAVVTVTACAWNARRLPVPTPTRTDRRLGRRAGYRLIAWLVARSPLSRAAFYFTVQTLSRSASHRIALASALAVGVSAALVMTGGSVMLPSGGITGIPLPIWAAQTMVLAAVVAGIRRALILPVQLSANWVFQMAWSGDMRTYATGVKRASVIVVLMPVVLALLLWQGTGLGLRLATAHGVVGLVLALIFLETAFLSVRRLPFACSYTSGGNVAGLGLTLGLLVLLTAFVVAAVERSVLPSMMHFASFLVVLLLAWVCVAFVGAIGTHSDSEGGLAAGPDFPTQRLDLTG